MLAAGAFQAAAYGMYETVFPLYLQHLGISFLNMGAIFGLSSVGVLAVRYVVGSESDRHGRKPFFVGSLAVAALSTALTPAWPHPVAQAALKTVRDAAGVVRDVMRLLVVYEHSGTRFVRWIGRFVGSEFFFMALGAVAAGGAVTAIGYGPTFWVSGGLSGVACAVLWTMFKERRVARPRGALSAAEGRVARPRGALSAAEGRVARSRGARAEGVFVLDLPPRLWVITVSDFIFNAGLMTSHSFYLLLFWKEKFGYAVAALGVIQMLHRFSLGIPMILAGHAMDRPAVRRHYHALYIGSMAAQGICIALAGIIPAALPAVAIFLVHDIVGATIFGPIRAAFVQREARPERRGRDVALSSGLSSLGTMIGPLLAGWLVDRMAWRDGPYVASGALIVAASLLMFRLKDRPGLAKRRAEAVG